MLPYEFFYTGYLSGYLTLEQLKESVVDGNLTKEQFKQITGADYTP